MFLKLQLSILFLLSFLGASNAQGIFFGGSGRGESQATCGSNLNGTIITATKLDVATQPTSSPVNQAFSVSIAIEDEAGNVDMNSSAPVTIAFQSNPNGGVLSGTLTVNAVNGVATFSNLVINTSSANPYTLVATSPGLTQTITSNIYIVSPVSLAITVQPTSSIISGTTQFSLSIEIRDQLNNRFLGSTASITLALQSNNTGATFSGTGTSATAASAGLFSTTNLTINKSGVYNIVATSPGLTQTVSTAVTIINMFDGGNGRGEATSSFGGSLNGPISAGTRLDVATQPTSAPVNQAFSVSIAIEDEAGNVDMNSSAPVTIAFQSNPNGGVLSGSLTVNAVNGVATFSNLAINTSSANPYTLVATSPGLTQTLTSNIYIVSPVSLAITVQPTSSIISGTTQFSLSIEIRDQLNNRFLGSTASITLALQSNTTGATFSGTGTSATAASAGLFSTTNLTINKSGVYNIVATSPGLTQTVSTAVTIINMFDGGNGRGEATASTSSQTLSGIEAYVWRGGNSSSPTNWNDPLNWIPNNTVPPNGALVLIEPISNGHFPILDQNRTVSAINFQYSGKKLQLGNYDLTVTGTISNFDSTQYVQTDGTGRLKRNVSSNESFTFPVGKSSYNPVSITNKTGISDEFAVSIIDAVYENGTSGTVQSGSKINRTWNIDKANPTADLGQGVDFSFQWRSNDEFEGPFEFNLTHYNGTNWQTAIANGGTPNVTGTSIKTLIFPGYKGSFSPFFIAGESYSPLPVELLYLKTNCQESNTVDVEWATASEQNSSHFLLQQSRDGSNWQNEKTVMAAGNSTEKITYLEKIPSIEESYIRLIQFDINGDSTIYGPVLNTCKTEDFYLNIFPNPNNGNFQVIMNHPTSFPTEIQLLDITGKNLKSIKCDGAMENSILLYTFNEKLKAGNYLVKIQLENGLIINKKITVQ